MSLKRGTARISPLVPMPPILAGRSFVSIPYPMSDCHNKKPYRTYGTGCVVGEIGCPRVDGFCQGIMGADGGKTLSVDCVSTGPMSLRFGGGDFGDKPPPPIIPIAMPVANDNSFSICFWVSFVFAFGRAFVSLSRP